jgi:periplasmic mercuric ion binding protein
MQTLKTFLFIVIAATATSFAQAQQFNAKGDGPFVAFKNFKVLGKCEMCKHRIENSIKNLPGIGSSNWDLSSQTWMVIDGWSKVKPKTIEKPVSAAGHDIASMNSTSDAYNRLPECCRYQGKS